MNALKSMALAAGLGAAITAVPVLAKVSAEKAAELDGPKYTCNGAERAGTASGVPAFSGKYQGTWPGVSKPYGYEPGPYAGEKPLFTITAQNMQQYADKLTEGEKALLAKYPQGYRLVVYPSHRDFKDLDSVCRIARQNAVTSEVVHDGRGVTGATGAIPFPFPASGIEAIWDAANASRAWTERVIYDIADVYASGSVAWGRTRYLVDAKGNEPGKRHSYQDPIQARFLVGFLLPERYKGFVSVGYQPADFTSAATQAWQYLPGVRRVRQAPEIGFDYPVPPAGLRTVDDDSGFNGSPERYDWKLIGKREYYIPYDNFRINDPAIKYSELIKPATVNPDYLRYELHRVWVIEATLKPGIRHIYGRRIIYADEDSWQIPLTDNYDARNQLWRSNLITYHYSQEAKAWHRGVSIFHDLQAGTYEAEYLVNERGEDWWRLNLPMADSMFTPAAAAQGGH